MCLYTPFTWAWGKMACDARRLKGNTGPIKGVRHGTVLSFPEIIFCQMESSNPAPSPESYLIKGPPGPGKRTDPIETRHGWLLRLFFTFEPQESHPS